MRCDDCASYSKFSSIEASFFSFLCVFLVWPMMMVMMMTADLILTRTQNSPSQVLVAVYIQSKVSACCV